MRQKDELENRWIYEKVPIDLLDDAEMNANVMSDEEFNQLTENIGVSGLSSVPTCYKRANGRFTIISGHHRVHSCRKLGFTRIGILYTLEEDLTSDEITAIQLSHNSLHGTDNKNILKKLFESIVSIDFKRFAHINMDEIGNIDVGSIAAPLEKETFTVTIVLYNKAMRYFEELFGEVREAIKKSDVIVMAENDPNEELYLKLSKEISKTLDIRSSNIVFTKILELALLQLGEALGENQNEEEKK